MTCKESFHLKKSTELVTKLKLTTFDSFIRVVKFVFEDLSDQQKKDMVFSESPKKYLSGFIEQVKNYVIYLKKNAKTVVVLPVSGGKL